MGREYSLFSGITANCRHFSRFFLHESWVSGGEVSRPFTFATVMRFRALCFDLTSPLLLLKYCHSVGSGFYYPDCLNNIGSDSLLKLMLSFHVVPALGSREGCRMSAVGVD